MKTLKDRILDEAIIRLRTENNLSCRAVAEELGIEEYSVWYCMRRHGLAGKIRAHAKAIKRIQIDLDYALDQVGEVIIERGLNGGYIVTVGDLTGLEKMSIDAAVRSAINDEADGGAKQ
jgi:hypothetical protein